MTQPSFGTVAPTSRRAVAYIIDALIAAGIGIVLSILLTILAVLAGPEGMLGVLAVGGPIIWLVLVGWFVFYTFMQAGDGSIGMRAQGVRLVREGDGMPLGFGKALLRNVIFGLSAAIVVGYFTPLFDGSGRFQGWHDKVAGSLMLDARGGGGAITTPPTQTVSVPPRPTVPMPGDAVPNDAPPIPGLAAPMHSAGYAAPAAQPEYPAAPAAPFSSPMDSSPMDAPAIDETVRAEDVRRPAAPAPQMPTVQMPASPVSAPQMPAPPVPDLQTPAPPAPIAHPVAPVANEEALIAFVPGITQDSPPERRAPAPPAAPEAPAALAPAGGAAVPAEADIGDIEDTRISIPGHRLVFTWDDGTRVTVSRRTLFGRNPAPEEGAAVVSVRDETLSLSKTHFEAAAEASGGWIVDRHSTNGTVIVRDGQRIACTPGEQVRVRLGDAIEIGDRIVTIGGYA